MYRNLRVFNCKRRNNFTLHFQKQTFLTNDYKCNETWKEQTASPMFSKINLNDFYNIIDLNYSSKGVISAIDVDIFANAVNDSVHLDELRDLLHKLRLSAETGNMLESTHQAIIRNYIEFGNMQDLISILKDPLNFGLFLDEYTANILLDKLIKSSEFELASNVASLVMLQEDFNNEITCALCQYACYKYVMGYRKPPPPEIVKEKKKKVEEIKIRVKFLRNPYFDDHFDITDIYMLSGKTLAWISERNSNNISVNLQIIGWLSFKKYDKLFRLCKEYADKSSFKVYNEVIELLKKEMNDVEEDIIESLQNCISKLSLVNSAETPLEESIKTMIENSINKVQNNDIKKQNELFQIWTDIRKQKLDEQSQRLDRAKRIELINLKQKDLQNEEQKLWFFENEDNIDLQIEEKDKRADSSSKKKKASKDVDDDYIPPEILPKRR